MAPRFERLAGAVRARWRPKLKLARSTPGRPRAALPAVPVIARTHACPKREWLREAKSAGAMLARGSAGSRACLFVPRMKVRLQVLEGGRSFLVHRLRLRHRDPWRDRITRIALASSGLATPGPRLLRRSLHASLGGRLRVRLGGLGCRGPASPPSWPRAGPPAPRSWPPPAWPPARRRGCGRAASPRCAPASPPAPAARPC